MTEWVHCNCCQCLPGSNAQKFFLTSCGHVLCERCLNTGTRGKCSACNQQCNIIEINRQMKPEMRLFFTDSTEIVKKQQKQLIQVLAFQKTQRERMIKFYKVQQRKVQLMVEQFQQEMRKKEELKKELAVSKEQCRQLTNALQQSRNVPSISNNFRIPFSPVTVDSDQTIREAPLFARRANERTTPSSYRAFLAHLTPSGLGNGATNTNQVGVPMSTNLSTPRLLGLDRSGNDGFRTSDTWNRNVSPLTSSPIVGVATITTVPSVPQIRLPFRLNANSLPR